MKKESIAVTGALLAALSGCDDGIPKRDGVAVMKALAQKNPENLIGHYMTLSGEEGKPDRGVIYVRNVFRKEDLVCASYRFFSSSQEQEPATESQTKQVCVLDEKFKPDVSGP